MVADIGTMLELEVLRDFAAVVVDEVAVDRCHGALIVANADASLEVVADAEEPLATEGPVVEIFDPEGQVVQVGEENVVVDTTVFAVDHEVTQVETHQVARSPRV